MAKKSWHIDRRAFLRGAGVVCALPMLEGMSRALDGDSPPKRLCFVYFPNGASVPARKETDSHEWSWFPIEEGEDFEFTNVLGSLRPFQQDLSIYGGTSHPLSRELLGHLAGDSWLTAGDLRGDRYKNRISVDQVAARHKKLEARYPSLVLSIDGGVGYKSRVSTLSFDANGRPIPSEHRHRQIFERYFAPQGGATTAERRASLRREKKIVDLILEDSKSLQRRLGAHDREKLDQYLESLRKVEEQVRRSEEWLDVPMKDFDASHLKLDPNPKVDPQAYVRTMFDLIVLGFQVDLTRVMTYMVGREDGMGFADLFPKLALGIPKGHHTISHDTHEGHWEEWGRYDRWLAEQFSYFVQRMHETRDEYGSLLDNTLILYGSSCSTTHNARNYPTLLAGGKNMGLRHGHYTRFDEETPFSNVLLTMLIAAGVPAESFGDSTGIVPGMLV